MSAFVDKKRPSLSAKGLSFGIVASRFNQRVTSGLLKGAQGALKKKGARQVDLVWVPGAIEIPFALQRLARRRRYDALIALGAVIRGETAHFEHVAREASRGVMEVMLREEVPVGFGILTTDTERQAMARAGGRSGNKGMDAAEAAIEMAWMKRYGIST